MLKTVYIFFLAAAAAGFAKDRGQTLKNLRSRQLIYDWSALGSGCHGRLFERGGDASLYVTPPVPPFLNRHHLLLKMNALRLESPVPEDQGKTNLEFARDCAIRIALNPPQGKKILNIEADSTLALTKSRETEMKTLAQLSLGMDLLGSQRLDFDKSEAFTDINRELHLASDPRSKTIGDLRCGQAKLLAIDLLLYVKRRSVADVVSMSYERLALDITIDLETCSET